MLLSNNTWKFYTYPYVSFMCLPYAPLIPLGLYVVDELYCFIPVAMRNAVLKLHAPAQCLSPS